MDVTNLLLSWIAWILILQIIFDKDGGGWNDLPVIALISFGLGFVTYVLLASDLAESLFNRVFS